MALGCGRIDRHDEHHWTSPVSSLRYRCGGDITVEGGYWPAWDLADDAAEDRADRDKREVS